MGIGQTLGKMTLFGSFLHIRVLCITYKSGLYLLIFVHAHIMENQKIFWTKVKHAQQKHIHLEKQDTHATKKYLCTDHFKSLIADTC